MRDFSVQDVEKIHGIIERYSTDVIDYELAAEDINAMIRETETPDSAVAFQRWLDDELVKGDPSYHEAWNAALAWKS